MPRKNPAMDEEQYFSRYPLTSPNYLVARIAGNAIRERAEKYFTGRLLDIGCGTKSKTALVADFVDDYIGLDHITTPHDPSQIDVYGTAFNIPARDSTFDSILCTAVLEHLERPQRAICEACRVLKPNGHALYTVPLFWHLHEQPRDFFRFTRHGLAHLFHTAGFAVVEITPLSGFFVTFGTEWNYYLSRFSRKSIKWMIHAAIAMNNKILPWLDQTSLRDERFTWMYIAVVRKSFNQ